MFLYQFEERAEKPSGCFVVASIGNLNGSTYSCRGMQFASTAGAKRYITERNGIYARNRPPRNADVGVMWKLKENMEAELKQLNGRYSALFKNVNFGVPYRKWEEIMGRVYSPKEIELYGPDIIGANRGKQPAKMA